MELAPLKQLQVLDLSGSQVGDAGLKDLAALKGLRSLALYGTKVTDKGLKDLAAVKQLEVLFVRNEVTDEGLRQLQKALPRLFVVR